MAKLHPWTRYLHRTRPRTAGALRDRSSPPEHASPAWFAAAVVFECTSLLAPVSAGAEVHFGAGRARAGAVALCGAAARGGHRGVDRAPRAARGVRRAGQFPPRFPPSIPLILSLSRPIPPLLSLARPPSLPLPLPPALHCPSLPLAHSPALPLPLAARAAPRPPGAALFMPLPSIRHPPVEHRDIAMQSSSAENVPTRGD